MPQEKLKRKIKTNNTKVKDKIKETKIERKKPNKTERGRRTHRREKRATEMCGRRNPREERE